MSPVVFGSLAAINGAVIAQVGYALSEYWRHESDGDASKESGDGPDDFRR
jgi:hypothetical protein